MLPKVSIIVPVYNVEPYIDKCLQSITGQTYQNLEIICVNDCSTDKSVDIVRKYASQDGRVQLFSTKVNSGLSAARNVGMEQASGEYLTFIDSDDFISNTYIEDLVQEAQKSSADITLSKIYQFDHKYDSADLAAQPDKVCKEIPHIGRGVFKKYPDLKNKADRIFPTSWGKLYKTQYIKSKSARFIKSIIHEDEVWSLLTLDLTDKIKSADKAIYFYRVNRQGALTGRHTADLLKHGKAFIRYINAFRRVNKLLYKKQLISNELYSRNRVRMRFTIMFFVRDFTADCQDAELSQVRSLYLRLKLNFENHGLYHKADCWHYLKAKVFSYRSYEYFMISKAFRTKKIMKDLDRKIL